MTPSERELPVAVFDSGVGGLTVLHECLVSLPHEHFTYLGDTARFPYGDRSQGELLLFARELAAILLEEGARDAAGWARLLSPFTLVDGVSTRLLGAESAQPVGPPGLLGGVVFALAAALLVAGCWLALLRRYRKVSVS